MHLLVTVELVSLKELTESLKEYETLEKLVNIHCNL